MSTADRHDETGRLFLAASERPEHERRAFLDRMCGGDASLRAEVEGLLARDRDHPSFLESPLERLRAVGVDRSGSSAQCGAAGASSQARPPVPAHIGPYSVIRVLGEGGMGIVYLAEQRNPSRQVALKVIKPWFTSPGVLKRFEYEAEVLGRLHHPAIGQVFEAGVATLDYEPAATGEPSGARPSGCPVPFFAMEYVQGRTLTDYAAAKQLGTRDRLRLLAQVCAGVQHAHQMGVIHRDLKPANVLVAEDGQPKILDFGVARAAEPDAQITLMKTDVGQLVGTVPYMSPEQVLGNPADLDTRSDIYALGVVGYELLAGKLPYDLGNKAIFEAARVIREDSPTPLSSVNRLFRGDLERIFATALEKNKNRRYSSASDFAGDIDRFLQNQPIQAHPPSTLYQLGKLARRNWALVSGIAATIAALLFGLALAAGEARSARRAERRSRMSTEFLEAMLMAPDPVKLGREAKIVDALDWAATKVRTEFAEEPEVEGSLRLAIGRTYETLGLYPEAEEQISSAVRLLRLETGSDTPDSQTAAALLGLVLQHQEKLDQAGQIYETLLPSNLPMTEWDPEQLTIQHNVVLIRQQQGRVADAEQLFRQLLEVQVQKFGPEDESSLTTRNSLATLLSDSGRLKESAPLLQQVLDARTRILGEGHPDTLSVLNNLAALRLAVGELDQAASLFQHLLDLRNKTLGAEHPDTLNARNGLASALIRNGQLAEAESQLVELVEVQRRVSGPEHSDTLIAMNSLGRAYGAAEKWEDARRIQEEILETAGRVLEDAHPYTLVFRANYGRTLGKLGLCDEAESHLKASLDAHMARREPDPRRITEVRDYLVELYNACGKPDLAAAYRAQPSDTNTSRSAENP